MMKKKTKRSRPQTRREEKQTSTKARTAVRSKKTKPRRAKKETKNVELSKADVLAANAKSLSQAAEFSGQLRKIKKLNRQEHDFSSLDEEDAEFAVFWEYRRDIEDWHVRPPSRIEGTLWEKWKQNRQFFPLPYVELKKAGVLNVTSTVSAERKAAEKKASEKPTDEEKDGKRRHTTCHPMWSDTPSPAFRECDFEEFKEILAQPPNHRGWSLIKKVCNIDPLDFIDFGDGSYALKRTGSLSMHCIVLDWGRGSKAIRDEVFAWLKLRARDIREDQPELRGRVGNREKLFQLGAWRARRAGHSAKSYYELRGGKRASFGKSDNPSYKSPKAFRTAADAAEEALKSLLRKKVTE